MNLLSIRQESKKKKKKLHGSAPGRSPASDVGRDPLQYCREHLHGNASRERHPQEGHRLPHLHQPFRGSAPRRRLASDAGRD
eukprot:661266-Amphidinium_carterae.1